MKSVGKLLVIGMLAGCGATSGEDEVAASETLVSTSSALTNAECNQYNGNVNACNAAGCAYYYCSNKCYVPGTSNCNAGCTSYCNCRAYDGNVNGCNAAGCAYYYCSNQCHTPGTSNCSAGCTSYCNCRAYDGNVNGCNAAGCAYYACSNQCHTPGTSNCNAGCNSYCADTYDYNSECPSPAGGALQADTWNFYKCECTSYAADKVNERGIAFNNWYLGVHWGDASNWVNAANAAGVLVTTTPQAGDVAWWNGHVAYVQSVNANGTVNITEYNYTPYDFGRRQNVTATKYIRF